ncbi:MAG: polysaccharide deacetylase family protein [Gammaproteobacteria bacterium]|nr:polysaccharide deacetylase family protein [Gammaproteobacteria bacterium]
MKPVSILMYHSIDICPKNLGNRGIYVSPQNFSRQMGLLARLGFQGLSMTRAMPYLTGKKTGRVAVITLDDGYEDNIFHALPVLKRYHFSATCYLVSHYMGRHNKWDEHIAHSARKPLMNWRQASEWLSNGMEVGAHSRTHPRLTNCSDVELKNEIAGCRKELEDGLGTAIPQFCYPYGDWDQRVADAVEQAGFHAAAAYKHGRVKADSHLFALPRLNMKGSKGWRRFIFNCLASL